MPGDNTPLYLKIVEDYKAKILSGELKADERLPSELDVAAAFGVSRITSKRALEELERKGFVYRIKGSGSYVSDISKRELAKAAYDQTRVIDFVIPFDSSKGRCIDLIRGANDCLQKAGYLLNIQNSNLNPTKERDLLLSFLDSSSAGMIFYPSSSNVNYDLMHVLSLSNRFFVTVDKYFENLAADSIVSDNFKGSYDATSYLIAKGHKNIGFISDMALEAASTVRDRFLGYCYALKDKSLPIKHNNYVLNYIGELKSNDPESYEIIASNKPLNTNLKEFFKRLLDRMLDRKEPVSAINALNDYVAMHLIKTAIYMGVQVPKELSVIGFDNLEFSQYLEVPLTTVEQDFYNMGYLAAENLLNCVMGNKMPGERIIIPTRIIERESVRDPDKIIINETTA